MHRLMLGRKVTGRLTLRPASLSSDSRCWSAAERLALHLETQVDRVSSPGMAPTEEAFGAL